MLKPIGGAFASVAKTQSENLAARVRFIHEVLGAADIADHPQVRDACGRLLMEIHSGKNRNYDSQRDKDWTLVRGYLAPAAA